MSSYPTQPQIEEYRQAVFKMLECVSPEVADARFHDAINKVIMKRKVLGNVNLDKLNIDWNKWR